MLQDRLAASVAEIRHDPRAHPLRTTLLKVELLPYQMDGIAFAVGAGRAVLADDMGLGKTTQTIGVAELLAREVEIGKALVVCPASVKSQWRSEILRFSSRDCQIVWGGPAARAKWDLIVLDEGQRIKNWEAKTTQTMKTLRSPIALVLNGTPLENKLDDLFFVYRLGYKDLDL